MFVKAKLRKTGKHFFIHWSLPAFEIKLKLLFVRKFTLLAPSGDPKPAFSYSAEAARTLLPPSSCLNVNAHNYLLYHYLF